jgi:hypothetical protein
MNRPRWRGLLGTLALLSGLFSVSLASPLLASAYTCSYRNYLYTYSYGTLTSQFKVHASGCFNSSTGDSWGSNSPWLVWQNGSFTVNSTSWVEDNGGTTHFRLNASWSNAYGTYEVAPRSRLTSNGSWGCYDAGRYGDGNGYSRVSFNIAHTIEPWDSFSCAAY